jgi:acetyl esterase/lipase
MNKFIIYLISLFLSFAALARGHKEMVADAHYGPHERQIFDLWMPKSLTKTPLVIYIHGGGWVQGSKDDIHGNQIIQKYLKAGIAFAAINYRYLKHAPLQTIMREDIAGFVQYIRYHAKKYNINKELVMSHGFSAGGSASLWLGTHDDIADEDNIDPVKRESSRMLAVGHLSAQVSYDFIDWYEYFDHAKVDLYVGKQVWSRYHLSSIEELYTKQGMEIRQDLDMYENMSGDDAPVLFWNGLPDIESQDGSHFMHSPRHAKLLYARSQSLGLEAKLILDGDKVIKTDVMGEAFKFFRKKINP